jgi:hypothetical protein
MAVVAGVVVGLLATAAMTSAQPATARPDPGDRLTIGTQSFRVQPQSIKCELGGLDGLSILRLTDCGSATLLRVLDHPATSLIRFEIKPHDAEISQGTRAELRDLHESVNGEETWYRLTTALPDDFPVERNQRLVLTQWHEHAPPGGDSLRPPLAHRLVDGALVLDLWNQAIYDKSNGLGKGLAIYRDPAFKLGVWHEFVYRIIWNPGPAGRVTGWRRERCLIPQKDCTSAPWREFVDYRGAIGYPSVLGYYFKFGVYTTHAFQTPLTVYHADFKRGATAADVGATDDIFRH